MAILMTEADPSYRKLIGDAKWPTTTPFEEALGEWGGQNVLTMFGRRRRI